MTIRWTGKGPGRPGGGGRGRRRRVAEEEEAAAAASRDRPERMGSDISAAKSALRLCTLYPTKFRG